MTLLLADFLFKIAHIGWPSWPSCASDVIADQPAIEAALRDLIKKQSSLYDPAVLSQNAQCQVLIDACM